MNVISVPKSSKSLFITALFALFLGASFFGFNSFRKNDLRLANIDTLTDDQKRQSINALKGLEIYDGLEVTTFATEPIIQNPTNMDIDAKGRIWILEAYNYRPEINGNPTNAKGDRIMILEDTNGDGKTDLNKVFYQGAEINSPLGIAVLGNKVIVSQSPYVWVFTDENGDDKADKKEILFQGIGGDQHDHGVHAFVFGPDGKLYFNMGNEGKQLLDKNGKPVISQDGVAIDAKNYKQGLVFRCDEDGSNVEVLGQNFRNNFELAVDSYGTMWQSDNDDDGNKGTRINYVMPYGNYGYTDEITAAGWRSNRTNIEADTSKRHWHLNDPGSIPNLLQTGSGSPTGMIVYEGNLLPEIFQNQMIHCEPGHNVVRSYPVKNDGAGYKAKIQNVVKGARDQWFRPADVCAAPDGSIFIADWYDPGVGGHQAGDQLKGRVYRVAPKGKSYTLPKLDFTTAQGAIEALQNPNVSARYLAFKALQKMGDAAIPALEDFYNNTDNLRMKARAFWLLAKSGNGEKYISEAANSENADFRIMALRATVLLKKNISILVAKLANDENLQVLRECALSLRYDNSLAASKLLAGLAMKHNGKDRWYLEAIGLGANTKSDAFFDEYLKINPKPMVDLAGKDIIWRTRSAKVYPLLASMVTDPTQNLTDKLRYFRAFDFINAPGKSEILLNILNGKAKDQNEINKFVLSHMESDFVKKSPQAKSALLQLIDKMPDNEDFTSLVDKYAIEEAKPRLLNLVTNMKGPGSGMISARSLVNLPGGVGLINKAITGKDENSARNSLEALRWVGNKSAVDLIKNAALNPKLSEKIRTAAFLYLGNSGEGETLELNLLKSNKIPKQYIASAVQSLNGSWKKSVREQARQFLGESKSVDGKKLPSINELSRMASVDKDGEATFKANCIICHQNGKEGVDFGPNLSAIGDKLTKEAMLNSIIYPDNGINFGYEGWEIAMKDGSTQVGIIASKTETDIILKALGGTSQNIKTSQVKSMKMMKNSLMPTGLHESMTTQQLVDLVGYMKTLH